MIKVDCKSLTTVVKWPLIDWLTRWLQINYKLTYKLTPSNNNLATSDHKLIDNHKLTTNDYKLVDYKSTNNYKLTTNINTS